MSTPTLSDLLEIAVRMEAQLTAAGITTVASAVNLRRQVSLHLHIAGGEAELDQALALLGLDRGLRSFTLHRQTPSASVSSADAAKPLGIDWLVVTAQRDLTADELAEALAGRSESAGEGR